MRMENEDEGVLFAGAGTGELDPFVGSFEDIAEEGDDEDTSFESTRMMMPKTRMMIKASSTDTDAYVYSSLTGKDTNYESHDDDDDEDTNYESHDDDEDEDSLLPMMARRIFVQTRADDGVESR